MALDRGTWIAEQLAAPSRLHENETGGALFSAEATHYGDIFSTLATGTARLGIVEIRLLAQKLLFGNYGERSRQFRPVLASAETTLGAEIGKTFFTTDSFYGRIAAGAVALLPGNNYQLRFALETGALPTPSLPWVFRLGVYALPGLRTDFYLHARLEVGRRLGDRWNVGGFLGWTNVMNGRSTDGTYDKTLFSLGPFAEWSLGGSWLRASLSLRAFIDNDIRNSASGTPTVTSVSGLGLPDATMAWALAL